jgi:hypothetical protein
MPGGSAIKMAPVAAASATFDVSKWA